jgi:hypothetical protein
VPQRVRKRDGREVPFDARKIEAAVAKALSAVGEDEAEFAVEIAGVVTLTLENRYDAPASSGVEAVPDIEEIQDLVERALIELGRANVAKAYILYRDRRARAREALQVHPPAEGVRPQRSRVEVQTPERTSPWSKGRIVAALINEAQLTRDVAEKVAGRVEERVFNAGLRRISTTLVRELVDNELVSLGLATALQRQVSFGLPGYDLRAWLQQTPEPLDPAHVAAGEVLAERRVEARVASEVLRRFALGEVLTETTAQLHLAGDVHVVDIGRPQQPLSCAVPASLVTAGAPGVATAFDVLEELALLAAEVAHGVVVEDAATLLQPLAGPGKSGATIGAWLRALTAIASAAGRNVDLSIGRTAARGHAITERVIEELAALPPSVHCPRLFLDHDELRGRLDDRSGDEAFASAVEGLMLSGRLIATWGSEGEQCVGPGLHRGEQERGALTCGGAVAINLARVALRAGPWREDRALEVLSSTCSAAVEALSELSAFQQRTRGARPADVRGRVAYAITPVGLREALVYLGDGEIRPDQGARLLGFLGDALRRAGEARKMAIVLTPFFGERARKRFAALDAELPQHAQRLLFGERAGNEAGAPYSVGYRLSPVPGRAIWGAEAELLATVAVGALHPLPEDRSRGGVVGLLDAWRRFDRLREERGESDEPGRDASRPGPAAGSPLYESVPPNDQGSARERTRGKNR